MKVFGPLGSYEGLRPNDDKEVGLLPKMVNIMDFGQFRFKKIVHDPLRPMKLKWDILGPSWPKCYGLMNVSLIRAQIGFLDPK